MNQQISLAIEMRLSVQITTPGPQQQQQQQQDFSQQQQHHNWHETNILVPQHVDQHGGWKGSTNIIQEVEEEEEYCSDDSVDDAVTKAHLYLELMTKEDIKVLTKTPPKQKPSRKRAHV